MQKSKRNTSKKVKPMDLETLVKEVGPAKAIVDEAIAQMESEKRARQVEEVKTQVRGYEQIIRGRVQVLRNIRTLERRAKAELQNAIDSHAKFIQTGEVDESIPSSKFNSYVILSMLEQTA